MYDAPRPCWAGCAVWCRLLHTHHCGACAVLYCADEQLTAPCHTAVPHAAHVHVPQIQGGHKYRAPRYDVNCPDLYVPLMAAWTYSLLVCGVAALHHKFVPDTMYRTARGREGRSRGGEEAPMAERRSRDTARRFTAHCSTHFLQCSLQSMPNINMSRVGGAGD